jgi:hypothetical protein
MKYIIVFFAGLALGSTTLYAWTDQDSQALQRLQLLQQFQFQQQSRDRQQAIQDEWNRRGMYRPMLPSWDRPRDPCE